MVNKVSGGLFGKDGKDSLGEKIIGGLTGSAVGSLIAGPAGAAFGLAKGLFAEGIDRIPPGFNNDNFLAGLSSGERVVPATTNRKLESFLERGVSMAGVESLLGAISRQLENPIIPDTKVVIGTREFARIMYDARTTNQRI